MSILKLLKQPYPLGRSLAGILASSFGTGLFIACFLLFFQPFGITEFSHPHKTLIFSIFGVITTAVMLIFGLLQRLMREERWTIGRSMTWTLLMILSICVLNMLYSAAMGFTRVSLSGFLTYTVFTLALSVFPVVVLTLVNYTRSLRKHVEAASRMNVQIEEKEHVQDALQSAGMIVFIAENGKDRLELMEDQLLYAESADNYSSIHYMEADKPKKVLLRASLKRLEEQVSIPFIIRCHRAYIVNLHKVRSVSGNSQGYKLHFEETGTTVPVSRTLGKELLEKLKTMPPYRAS